MVQTIDIRSFGSNPFTSKVLLLIDGVPYNSWNKGGFPQHPGFDFFNLENVKHIEVIRGSGSALYGENAFNGVINILTLTGEEFQQARVSGYGGQRNTRSAGVAYGKELNGDLSFFGSFRSTRTQLPLEMWADEADADAEGYDLFLKGRYRNWQATYYRRSDSFEGFEHDPGSPTLPPGSVFRSTDEIEQDVDIATLSHSYAADDGAWSVRSTASYAQRNGSHCAACHAPAQAPGFDQSEDHGYQLFGNTQLALRPNDSHELLFGGEFRRIDAGGHEHELHDHSTHAHEEALASDQVTGYRKHAFFAQDVWSLTPRTDLIAGLRYESGTSPALFSSRLFPRVSLVSRVSERLTMRAGWSKAARYPSFTELYQNSWFLSAESDVGTLPLAEFEPNFDLEPEEIESYEIGLGYRFSKKVEAKLDLYQNRVTDPIVIAYPRFRFENHAAEARVRGFELDLRAKPNAVVHAFANWAYQHNAQRGNGTDSVGNALEFTYAPAHKVNVGATITPFSPLRATLEATWRDRYVGPAFWYLITSGDPTPRPLDSYVYVNARLDYEVPISDSGSLNVSLQVRNLTNERPYETLSGFGGRVDGREVMLGIEYAFGS